MSTSQDARVLELVADVCGLLDIDEFRHGLLEALNRAVPSDYVSLNDVGPSPETVVVLMRPEVEEMDRVAGQESPAEQGPTYFEIVTAMSAHDGETPFRDGYACWIVIVVDPYETVVSVAICSTVPFRLTESVPGSAAPGVLSTAVADGTQTADEHRGPSASDDESSAVCRS